MRGAGTLRLGQLFGIRIGVSRTWFLVLFVVIYVLERVLPADPRRTGPRRSSSPSSAALLFFATVVAHELGHALVARRLGMADRRASTCGRSAASPAPAASRARPGAELALAAAGPAVNALVIALCVGAGLAFGSFTPLPRRGAARVGPARRRALVLLSWLALINAVLLVFNLLPALPLDGGRIARAIVWRLTGDAQPRDARLRAARAAARRGVIGRRRRARRRARSAGYGLWFVLIGLFLDQAARQALARSRASARAIRAVTVGEIMDREPVTVPSADDAARRPRSATSSASGAPWLAGHRRGRPLPRPAARASASSTSCATGARR